MLLKFSMKDVAGGKCSTDLILQLLREDNFDCDCWFMIRSTPVTCTEYSIFYYESSLWYVHGLLE